MRRHAAISSFHGDPNVGLYGVATDKFCIVGKSLPKKKLKELSNILNVSVIPINIYGTELVGLFIAANSKAVLLPDITYKSEIEKIRKELSKLDVKVGVIKTEHTALGNNIILNDTAGIISPVYNKSQLKKIKEAFPNVKFEQFKIAGLSIPGSVGVVTNKGGIFNPNIKDKDIKKIEKLFGFEIGLGTVNMGNPFVSSGLIANSFGFVVGEYSSGYEIARIDESLGFLK